MLFASFARVSRFFSPFRGYRSGEEMFHSFSFTTYYSLHCVNGERILLTGKSFFSYIAGLHMSREIIPKWCKTKPTIESEYMCVRYRILR